MTVVRSGGIAGLRREWRAEPPPDAVDHWIALIAGCPWDETLPSTSGADRYQWSISAHGGDQAHEARLGDGQIHGPWRTLVDEVRAASRASRSDRAQ